MVFALVITRKDTSSTTGHGGRRIRCPKCVWEPSRTDRWSCDEACGHIWNTFETAGCCPGCGKQWTATKCPRCGVWSPHHDWYAPN